MRYAASPVAESSHSELVVDFPAIKSAGAAATPYVSEHRSPWLIWVLPSIADVIFLVLLCVLSFRPEGTGLLGDADIGWHIRNGEHILATHAVPHTDSFSYTRAGQPWFAWEWLYDVAIAAVHQVAGLNGVVLCTLFIVCGTFAWLFGVLMRRSGNLLVAAFLTMLAAAAAQNHLLARPHVVTWLFTLLWVDILYRFEGGQPKALLGLPPLMLIWVNMHGGFVLGLLLTCMFGAAAMWRYAAQRHKKELGNAHLLIATLASCLGCTLLTPYGYQLHLHVYHYLSSDFLMNSIQEFGSPNFHLAGIGYFECFLLMALASCAVARERLSITDLLIVLFALHSALFAARNIPIAVILAAVSCCRVVASAISPEPGKASRPPVISVLLERLDGFYTGMGRMEGQFRGHLLVMAVMAGSVAVALHAGRLLGIPVMAASFDEAKYPVAATEFLQKQGVHSRLFTTDLWSGYVIYRLDAADRPNGIKLFFDDRHDFYGESFTRDYLTVYGGLPQWREPLDAYGVQWVMVPVDLPLASLLQTSGGWQAVYKDGVAVIFTRRR